jgi:hypothetical protein
MSNEKIDTSAILRQFEKNFEAREAFATELIEHWSLIVEKISIAIREDLAPAIIDFLEKQDRAAEQSKKLITDYQARRSQLNESIANKNTQEPNYGEPIKKSSVGQIEGVSYLEGGKIMWIEGSIPADGDLYLVAISSGKLNHYDFYLCSGDMDENLIDPNGKIIPWVKQKDVEFYMDIPQIPTPDYLLPDA